MIDGPVAIVTFSDGPDVTAGDHGNGLAADAVDPNRLSYLAARETAERRAAKQAASLRVRRIHQELAQFYAAARTQQI